MGSILNSSLESFIRLLKDNRIGRFYFVFDAKSEKVIASHHELSEIAALLNHDQRDFQKHEGIFAQLSKSHDVIHSAFIHRTNRGQGAGGVRFWKYENVESFIRDGLRLAMGMTHKNALAGLWWGGAKGVMAQTEGIEIQSPEVRKTLYQEYGEFMTSLNGCYVTAEDVGTNVNDMSNIFSRTRFTTCIPKNLGGSGNPSVPTARGVVAGMEAALKFLGLGDLSEKTIVVQGLGNVARPMIKFLLEKGVGKISAFDIFPGKVEAAKSELLSDCFEAKLIDKSDTSLFKVPCDIFAPCATGAVINSETIPLLNTKIVCGAANNQLEEPITDDNRLYKRGIIYVPDFLTNRMGIVNCADEQAGYINNDPMIEQHLNKEWEFSVYQTALRVLQSSRQTGKTPGVAAVEIAERLSMENNPIYGHRGELIISSLVENRWAENG